MTSIETMAQRGTVLPLVALSLAVILGFVGLAVDVAYLEYWQQKQQLATDAAALGGAQQLGHGNCSSAATAENAADADATLDGFANLGQTTVTAVSPPNSGPYANNPCAVSVQITTRNVSTFFSRVLGNTQGLSESTQAVAVSMATGTGCIYLLSATIDQNFNGAKVNSKCGILINNTANFNGSTVAAPYIGYAGSASPNLNGANFTEATPVPMLAISDPCPEIPGCAYLAASPPPTNSCTPFNGNGYNGTLAQGCYSNLNLNGANVTLSGTYVLSGGSNFNGAHITGSGVTIYVTADGTPPNFNGASVSLSPPASGNQIGVLYYQVPANTGSPNFNGSSQQYSGLLYAPAAPSANFNGSAGGYVVLVFGGVNFNGSNTQEFATPPPGQSLVTEAVIAQ